MMAILRRFSIKGQAPGGGDDGFDVRSVDRRRDGTSRPGSTGGRRAWTMPVDAEVYTERRGILRRVGIHRRCAMEGSPRRQGHADRTASGATGVACDRLVHCARGHEGSARRRLAVTPSPLPRHIAATRGPIREFPSCQQCLWISLCTTPGQVAVGRVVAGLGTDWSDFDRSMNLKLNQSLIGTAARPDGESTRSARRRSPAFRSCEQRPRGAGGACRAGTEREGVVVQLYMCPAA